MFRMLKRDDTLICLFLRYDLTDTAGVLENKVLGMFHGLDDYEGVQCNFLCKSDLKWRQDIDRR